MCGIFGGVGKYSMRDIQMLAVLNEVRGGDSFGVYDGAMSKTLQPPRTKIGTWESLNIRRHPFLIGHTRSASVGSVTINNAHPFHIGHVVGAHNGGISNFHELCKQFEAKDLNVDSQIIFWGLNDRGIDFLPYLKGTYSIAWWDDREPEFFWLACSAQQLATVETERFVLYSSDIKHLEGMGFPAVEVPTSTIYKYNTTTLAREKMNIPWRRPQENLPVLVKDETEFSRRMRASGVTPIREDMC